ncbi:unnamed protein product [Orchesella dallaii]|uniref:Uncharacterized protein n=1 Tax=Orchesella dallaii TaxID=48710 RepID=A0ABP1R585_9HEXA
MDVLVQDRCHRIGETRNTIRDLFTINEKDDVFKRLGTWNTEQNIPPSMVRDKDETTKFDPTEIDTMKSSEKKLEAETIECVLEAEDDDTDVHTTQAIHTEAGMA